MKTRCELLHGDLQAFLDDELRGPARQRVAQHLELCDACRQEHLTLSSLGNTLRTALEDVHVPRALDSLASRVISRTRAESAQSWTTLLKRGAEDWHWAIVGGGSVLATLISTTVLSVILAFGPLPQREDSLASLLDNLESQNLLFVYGSPAGEDRDVIMQVDNGQPLASPQAASLVRPVVYRPTEADLVGELDAAISRSGRAVRLDEMSPRDRRKVEILLDEIYELTVERSRDHRARSSSAVTGTVNVREVRLLTSTSVTAKGL